MEDYLLSMKNYIKKQIDDIEEGEVLSASINKEYKQIHGIISNDYIDLHEQFKELHKKQFFIGRMIDLKNLLDKIDIAIKSNCEHICCIDYVDINEDRIQKIQYCEKCWTTLDK
jgi:hypothetical protein